MNERRMFVEGDPIVVRTPDQREFPGHFVEMRSADRAVVRLDTGWVTTFPLTMLHHREADRRLPHTGPIVGP